LADTFDLHPAHRLETMPMYLFASLGTRLQELAAHGLDIIRLDIGSPDGPTPAAIVQALDEAAANPANHGYPTYFGTPRLRAAIADYYGSRYGVTIDPHTEVQPLIGSKEGIANMALAWLDPGDIALVPDPGYPTYRMSAYMAGAQVCDMPLLEENGFLPDLAAIPAELADRARLMWLNYPNNPTGAVAPMSFFAQAVDFCRRHNILLCHDAPYADVGYDGYRAPSLLSVPGAKDVAVEFNSLSKSHNMAGWRVGMAVGNATAVKALLQVKSNVDSGIFLPVQAAAVVALTGDQAWMAERNAVYQLRRDMIYDLLVNDWGLHVMKPAASLYLWPHVPAGYTSAQFTDKILLATGVSFTPGSAFGPHGEGYIRISVGQATERIVEAVRRLRELKF
jgi:LL-diaminopimelate aminotransferase